MARCNQCGNFFEISLALGEGKRVATCRVCPENNVYAVCEDCEDLNQIDNTRCPQCGANHFWDIQTMVIAGNAGENASRANAYAHDNFNWGPILTILGYVLAGVLIVAVLALVPFLIWGLPTIFPDIAVFSSSSAWVKWSVISLGISFVVCLCFLSYFRYDYGTPLGREDFMAALFYAAIVFGFTFCTKVLYFIYAYFRIDYIAWGAVCIALGFLLYGCCFLLDEFGSSYIEEETVTAVAVGGPSGLFIAGIIYLIFF